MAISVLQHTLNDNFATNSVSQAFGSNIAAGSLLVCFIFCKNNNGVGAIVPSVTDSLGNIWSQAVVKTRDSAVEALCYYTVNTKGAGADTVTFVDNGVGSAGENAIWIVEVSGANTIDTTASGSGSGTAMATGSFSTAQANEIILAFSISNDTNTSVGAIGGTTATTLDNVGGDGCGDEYLIVSSTQAAITAAMSLSASGVWAIVAASFYQATSFEPDEDFSKIPQTQSQDWTSTVFS